MTATTSKRQLTDAMSRQQAVIRNTQSQVLGRKAVPQLKPSGRFSAPTVRSQSPIVIKGGGFHYQTQARANLLTAVNGAASQMLIEPFSDIISDKIFFRLWRKHSEETFQVMLSCVR